ncbi:anhydro-N-acetylmuramic acid kinase [Sulfurimicrobium lacus]|uniref:Anhydro-N-acetylmuramic acid kinase n=1 Tax=Sulfurimicrobium lacus TaxID=2715678 RepID=A0A6F8V862_9PROT|nr:anhydro-N-acetylmuramic acid kinase [Sulfurimicrobium lacus]BCB25510.1 anhydro-N-acetylmuramic acid kinase [Sulfurimicrobium lacus]
MHASELYVGLMSGTSLDGVDAALVEISEGKSRLVHAIFQVFDDDLRQELLALNQAGHNELLRASLAGNALASRYTSAVQTLLNETMHPVLAISAIGCHGQTIRHRPDLGFTIQIGNAALLAELTGISVITDFRSRDIAAGGQGAPLVPAFHAAAFRSAQRNRVIVNIGGISNLTWLPATGAVTGFDCGPGNLLLDGWTQRHLGSPFDRDGAWAASGILIPELLHNMLDFAFFSAAPPKSTGRDMFHLEWLQAFLYGSYAPADVQATLLELSARSITDAIRRHCGEADEIYLCGGGAHNTALRKRLAEMLAPLPLKLTDEFGIGTDWVEATAFAWLAYRTRHSQPGNLPEVTGAQGPRILGAIYNA